MKRITRTIVTLAAASVAVTGVAVPAATAAPTTHTVSAAVVTQVKAISVGKKNAVRSAKSYLKYGAFSRKGLIEQLRFEGYSKKDATYGADHAKANWKKECAQSAKSYMEFMPFSRKELAAQLKWEGFTKAQIAYGLKAVGY
jgi:hypothetical protein